MENDEEQIVEQFKEKLEWVLDKQFPKGKCKERGNALVLYAQAVILFERCLKVINDDQELTKSEGGKDDKSN